MSKTWINAVREQIMLSKYENVNIREHLDDLTEEASKYDTIVELGRQNMCSTLALLLGKPKKFITVDVDEPSQRWFYRKDIAENYCEALGIEYEYRIADTLKMEPIKCEMMFIDTFHSYEQLYRELNIYNNDVSNTIVMHDTVSFGQIDEPSSAIKTELLDKRFINKAGLANALDDFLKENSHWTKSRIETKNNGMSYIIRI